MSAHVSRSATAYTVLVTSTQGILTKATLREFVAALEEAHDVPDHIQVQVATADGRPIQLSARYTVETAEAQP